MIRKDSFAAVLAACGCSPALFDDSDGTSKREALRQWHMGTVLPLARLIETELSRKLDAPIRLTFDNYAMDMVSRAQVVQKLAAAGVGLPVAHGGRRAGGGHGVTDTSNPCGRAWREAEHHKKFGAVHAPRIGGHASSHVTAPQRAGGGSYRRRAPPKLGGLGMKVEISPVLVEAGNRTRPQGDGQDGLADGRGRGADSGALHRDCAATGGRRTRASRAGSLTETKFGAVPPTVPDSGAHS